MGFNFLQKLRQTWSKSRTRKGSKGPTYFRPCLELLEERVVPTTRTWTGGSWLSKNWSDQFNWQNGVPQPGDSVFFPAAAKQRTNLMNLDLTTVQGDNGLVVLRALNDLHIEGGDYDISGGELDLTGKLSSDSGVNTIHDFLAFVASGVDTIDVGSGSLSLNGKVAGTADGFSCVANSPDLIKTGAGTLGVSNIVGVGVPSDPCQNSGSSFEHFTVQQGLLSLDQGGQTQVDLEVANGAIVRLQQGGDQIAGPGRLPNVTIDAGGVMDLNGHSEGLGNLTLNGAITTGAAGTLVIEGDVTTTASASSTAVISGRVDLGGTASTNRTFNVANGTAPDDLFINAVIQGAAKLIKDGNGRLTLTGDSANTYTGLTQVKAGSLNLAKLDNVEAIVGNLQIGDSLGNDHAVRVLVSSDEQISTNSQVRVNASGLLDLQGHFESLGQLILAGDVTSGATGTLRLVGDVSTERVPRMPTISGNLSLQGTRTFQVVDAVPQPFFLDMTIDAAIVAGSLTKTGPGELLLSGSNGNTSTGTTTVNEGRLTLAKSGGVAVNGNLVIGDGIGDPLFAGGPPPDQVVLGTTGNQIADSANVTVNSSGLLDLNNSDETINALTLSGGSVFVDNPNVRLTLQGNVTVLTAPTVATILGRVNLNSSARVFNVADSVAGTDLIVKGALVPGEPTTGALENGGLTKSGAGQMELIDTSSYTSGTTVNEGTLVVTGTLTSSSAQVKNGATLVVNGALTSGSVVLNGGTLRGKGSVNGIFDPNGRIQPAGTDFGTLTSTNGVVLQPGATFQPQILPVAPDSHDLLKVQGAVNLTGSALALQAQFQATIPAPTPVLLDDSSASFFSTGFTNNGGTGVIGNTYYFTTASNTTALAVWTAQNLQPGSYRVSAAWGFGEPNRASNVPYTIDTDTSFTTVRVNQKVTAADFSKFGVSWDILGVVQVTGNSLSVELTTNGADPGFVIADAILIEPRQVVIIDNDGTDPVVGNFANLPEGATASAVAAGVVNGQVVVQTQLYTISYHANDGNDVSLAYITTATAAQDLLITPASINEGEKATLTGHLTDPDQGDFLTLTIDWGDGKTETQHPGTAPFAFTHQYLNNPKVQPHGDYSVHLTWFDQHGAGNNMDLFITVNNVAPTLYLAKELHLFTGDMLVVPGYVTDPGVLDHLTVKVDFGDGTGVQSVSLNPANHFVLKHQYQRTGTYHVTVTVFDDDDEFDTVTLLVRVKARG
jgi:autotransporter-associated beta strand protein